MIDCLKMGIQTIKASKISKITIFLSLIGYLQKTSQQYFFIQILLLYYSMSESRLQNSLSIEQEEQKISDIESYSENQAQPNKSSSKPLGRPRGRGRPKLNHKPNSKKKESQQIIYQEPPKIKEKVVAIKQENQIEGYIRIVDFLKKIECDEISFQNKMNPFHSLTATSFWYMISAEYFSYDFFARKNPSEAANNILNKVSKIPVQMPMRFIKNTHTKQLLQFETQQVRAYGQNISEFLSQLIPPPSSINRSQNIEKKVSMSTVCEDNEFISSTRALLFNYVKGKLQKSEKWSSNIKSKLQKIQNLQPKQYIKESTICFEEEKQQIIDYNQLDILSRQAKKKKSQKKKSLRQSNCILEVNQQENDQFNKQQNQIANERMQIEQNNKNIFQNDQIQSKQDLNNKIQEDINLDIKSNQIEQQNSESVSMDRKLVKQMTTDQVLLSSIINLPLQKVISILQSNLHSNYNLPSIQAQFMPISKNDPLDLVFQLHDQEQKYLQYMKQYKKKQYRNKHNKNQNIIEQQQRQIQFQDAKCQICTDGDYTDDNLIVFCSRCNISLHQRCVGLAKVPAESWVCDVCLAFGPAGINVPCPMCNVKGGALKRTNIHIDNTLFKQLNPGYYEFAKKCPYNKHKQQYLQIEKQQNLIQNDEQKSKQQRDQLYYDYFNKNSYPLNQPSCHYVWVHYVCAIWVPECYFEQKNGAINIKGIENIDKRRYRHQCTVCKSVKYGACVKCDDQQCQKYYHPQCARKKKVYMQQLNLQKIKYLIFCEQHQPLKITRQIQYKKKKSRDQIVKFARMIQKYVQTYKIAYFPFKLMKIIPTKSFIQTCQKDQKLQQIQLKQQIKKQTDQQFIKDIIIKLSKVKKITVIIIKTESGFKINDMNQPSRRQMRKCLNRYDDFWHSIQNNQTPQQNWKRYQKIIKQNLFIKQKMEIFLNGGSLASPNNKLSQKTKKGKARGKNAKPQPQTQIQQQGGIFCICRKPYQNELDMFQCEICGQWYHYNCIGFIGTQQDAQSLQFHCMKCMKYQTQQQKKPRLQKCIQFFSSDSVFLNYRPPTPKLMSEEDPEQIKQSLMLESQQQQIAKENPQNSSQKADLKQNTQLNRPQFQLDANKKIEILQYHDLSYTKLKQKNSNKSDKSQNSIKSDKQKTVTKTNSNISPINLESQKMQTTLTQFFVGMAKKQKPTSQQKLAELQKSVQNRQYNNND